MTHNFKRLVLLIFLCVIFDYCTGIFPEDSSIQFSLQINNTHFTIADTLYIIFYIKNSGLYSKKFIFSTTCQHGFRIKSNGQIHNEQPKICGQAFTSFTVNPGEIKELMKSTQLVNSDGEPLPIGSYVLESFLFNENSPILKKNIVIVD